MKASEKTLELNVGAELLQLFRRFVAPRAYLWGLTQSQESILGVDNFMRLPSMTRVFAFQYKAPNKNIKQKPDSIPYKYTLRKYQHSNLYVLANKIKNSAFYVFPFFERKNKILQYSPSLLDDTWFLSIDSMVPKAVFGQNKSKVIKCDRGKASINPEYVLQRIERTRKGFLEFLGNGFSVETIQEWLEEFQGEKIDRPLYWLDKQLPSLVVIPSE